MEETALFSGKIYTADKNFTRPPVATVATNSKSVRFLSQLCAKTTKIQPIFLRPQRQESYKAWASRCKSTRYIIDALTNASQSAYKHRKEIYGKRKLWPTSQKGAVDNMFAFWIFDWWGCLPFGQESESF